MKSFIFPGDKFSKSDLIRFLCVYVSRMRVKANVEDFLSNMREKVKKKKKKSYAKIFFNSFYGVKSEKKKSS